MGCIRNGIFTEKQNKTKAYGFIAAKILPIIIFYT